MNRHHRHTQTHTVTHRHTKDTPKAHQRHRHTATHQKIIVWANSFFVGMQVHKGHHRRAQRPCRQQALERFSMTALRFSPSLASGAASNARLQHLNAYRSLYIHGLRLRGATEKAVERISLRCPSQHQAMTPSSQAYFGTCMSVVTPSWPEFLW